MKSKAVLERKACRAFAASTNAGAGMLCSSRKAARNANHGSGAGISWRARSIIEPVTGIHKSLHQAEDPFLLCRGRPAATGIVLMWRLLLAASLRRLLSP